MTENGEKYMNQSINFRLDAACLESFVWKIESLCEEQPTKNGIKNGKSLPLSPFNQIFLRKTVRIFANIEFFTHHG